jgi:chemotaxis protein histidine kinase CheA
VQITKQQQILGYFIEEAKEHLDSIEHGLLNLKDTMADAEEMNQMFRAAHSIKGGAAMLGFNSIQKVSHHLEDYFKLLKDNPIINIDHKLEDLFLKGFDALKALVDQLQGTFGLRDEDATQIVQSTEPVFAELGNYLNSLIHGGVPASMPVAAPVAAPAAKPAAQAAVAAGAADQVSKILKVMLQLFKQGDNPKSRQQLGGLCTRLMQLSPKSQPWVLLGQTAQKAILNPTASYTVLAPLIIKELKQSSDLLLAGRAGEILPSKTLQQLTKPAAARPAAASAAVPVAARPAVAVAPSLPSMVKDRPAAIGAQPVAAQPVAAQPVAAQQIAAQQVAAQQIAAQQAVEATMMTSIRPRTITVPAEPKAAARALLEAFNKNELIQLAEFLMKAIQT